MLRKIEGLGLLRGTLGVQVVVDNHTIDDSLVVHRKMCSQSLVQLEHIMGNAHGYTMSPELPQHGRGEACGPPRENTNTCETPPPHFAHRLPVLPCYLMLPHSTVL